MRNLNGIKDYYDTDDRADTKTLKVLQPRNAIFILDDNENKFNYDENICLDLWIDLSDSVQRRINEEKEIKTSFGNLTLIDNDCKLEVSEGNAIFISLILLLKALYVEIITYEDEKFSDELEDIKNCFYEDGKLRLISKNTNKLIDISDSGKVGVDDKSYYAQYYRFYQRMVKEHSNINKLLNIIMIQKLLYEFRFAVKVI